MRYVVLVLLGFLLTKTAMGLALACPEADDFDSLQQQRIGPEQVKFSFQGNQDGWSPIVLYVGNISMPYTQGIQPKITYTSIRLKKDKRSGDWVIICRYKDIGGFRSGAQNYPESKIVLPADEVSHCRLNKETRSVSCREES